MHLRSPQSGGDVHYKNLQNEKRLYPIGNVCVKKFGRWDLNKEVDLFQLLKLSNAIHDGKVAFTSEYFSRALLNHFYSKNVFTPNKWNNNDGGNDYAFLVKMFNKRNKDAITSGQRRKIQGLLDFKDLPVRPAVAARSQS